MQSSLFVNPNLNENYIHSATEIGYSRCTGPVLASGKNIEVHARWYTGGLPGSCHSIEFLIQEPGIGYDATVIWKEAGDAMYKGAGDYKKLFLQDFPGWSASTTYTKPDVVEDIDHPGDVNIIMQKGSSATASIVKTSWDKSQNEYTTERTVFSSGYYWDPAVCTDVSKNLLVAAGHSEAGVNYIKFRKSLPAGITFNDIGSITLSEAEYNFSMARSDERIILVSDNGTSIWARYSVDKGYTFSSKVAINRAVDPDVVEDAFGNFVAVFYDPILQIIFSSSTTTGYSWTEKTTFLNNVTQPTISRWDDKSLIVMGRDISNQYMKMARSTDGGCNWTVFNDYPVPKLSYPRIINSDGLLLFGDGTCSIMGYVGHYHGMHWTELPEATVHDIHWNTGQGEPWREPGLQIGLITVIRD